MKPFTHISSFLSTSTVHVVLLLLLLLSYSAIIEIHAFQTVLTRRTPPTQHTTIRRRTSCTIATTTATTCTHDPITALASSSTSSSSCSTIIDTNDNRNVVHSTQNMKWNLNWIHHINQKRKHVFNKIQKRSQGRNIFQTITSSSSSDPSLLLSTRRRKRGEGEGGKKEEEPSSKVFGIKNKEKNTTTTIVTKTASLKNQWVKRLVLLPIMVILASTKTAFAMGGGGMGGSKPVLPMKRLVICSSSLNCLNCV